MKMLSNDSRLMDEEVDWTLVWQWGWASHLVEDTTKNTNEIVKFYENVREILPNATDLECEILHWLGFNLHENDLNVNEYLSEQWLNSPLASYIFSKIHWHLQYKENETWLLERIELILSIDNKNTIEIEKLLNVNVWWFRWDKVINWICMDWMMKINLTNKDKILRKLIEKNINVSDLK